MKSVCVYLGANFGKNKAFKEAVVKLGVDVEHLLPKGYFLWSELDCKDPIYLQGRDFFNIDNVISASPAVYESEPLQLGIAEFKIRLRASF